MVKSAQNWYLDRELMHSCLNFCIAPNRIGVRQRFQQLFSRVYVEAILTILIVEKILGTQLPEHTVKISKERYVLRRQALQGNIESIVLETDAPDMLLAGLQAQRNTPENIPTILNILAELRTETKAEIAITTSNNCRKLFSLLN